MYYVCNVKSTYDIDMSNHEVMSVDGIKYSFHIALQYLILNHNVTHNEKEVIQVTMRI